MKRKILIGIAIMAITGVTVWNLNFVSKMRKMPDFSTANIEALASEGGGQLLQCWQTISSYGDGNQTHVTYCPGCAASLARSWSSTNGCTL